MGILDTLKTKKSKAAASAAPSKKSSAPVSRAGEASEQKQTEALSSGKPASLHAPLTLLSTHVSEKTTTAESTNNTYTFLVEKTATKVQIKQVFFSMYGIMPRAVRTVNMEGKRTRFGRKKGKRADMKKAYVLLPKGKTVSVHEGV